MDTKSATAILNLPIESIRLLDNLREVKPDDDLEELARDLVRHGFLQPLLVQPTETNDCFELVFGFRRYHAAKLAQISIVPCRIMSVDRSQLAKVRFAENHFRVDFNPIEKALFFKACLAEGKERLGHFTQEDLAAELGIKQYQIAQHLSLLYLAAEDQARVALRELHFKQALRLASKIRNADSGASARTDQTQPVTKSRLKIGDEQFRLDVARQLIDPATGLLVMVASTAKEPPCDKLVRRALQAALVQWKRPRKAMLENQDEQGSES